MTDQTRAAGYKTFTPEQEARIRAIEEVHGPLDRKTGRYADGTRSGHWNASWKALRARPEPGEES